MHRDRLRKRWVCSQVLVTAMAVNHNTLKIRTKSGGLQANDKSMNQQKMSKDNYLSLTKPTTPQLYFRSMDQIRTWQSLTTRQRLVSLWRSNSSSKSVMKIISWFRWLARLNSKCHKVAPRIETTKTMSRFPLCLTIKRWPQFILIYSWLAQSEATIKVNKSKLRKTCWLIGIEAWIRDLRRQGTKKQKIRMGSRNRRNSNTLAQPSRRPIIRIWVSAWLQVRSTYTSLLHQCRIKRKRKSKLWNLKLIVYIWWALKTRKVMWIRMIICKKL